MDSYQLHHTHECENTRVVQTTGVGIYISRYVLYTPERGFETRGTRPVLPRLALAEPSHGLPGNIVTLGLERNIQDAK